MSYNPENQYRCTIIRGKSQTEMEDLLPLYANIVHDSCPCREEQFRNYAYSQLSKALLGTSDFDSLSNNKKKTIKNHYTEVQGVLLGLYYPEFDSETGETYIHESESCRFLVENQDFPTFFKNLCLNYQFPNGEKKTTAIQNEIELGIHIKPFCYVVNLLYLAQSQGVLLAKQEVGYYVLNNLDVLCGKVSPREVLNKIVYDREHNIKRNKLSSSKEWQHINEQFNLLELANLIVHDATYVWLNKEEGNAVSVFIKAMKEPFFDVNAYNLEDQQGKKALVNEWKAYNGKFNKILISNDLVSAEITDRARTKAGSAIKSSTDLGDEGEALVFKLEQERVRAYKPRLVNKVLLVGKTKGLGYDISSIEADENPEFPEFARYIEVKATRRTTRPSFNGAWLDSLNITRKEWIAAQQFKECYHIYRVYFTKSETIIVSIQNPYGLAQENKIEVVPTIYQMDFNSSVIKERFTNE